MKISGEEHSGRGISKCKGPGVRMHQACLQNVTEAREAGKEWVRGEHEGNRVQGVRYWLYGVG